VLADACVRTGVGVRIPEDLIPHPREVLRSAWHDAGLRSRAQTLGRRLAQAQERSAPSAATAVEAAVTGRPGVGEAVTG
jgi:hypothetical protein